MKRVLTIFLLMLGIFSITSSTVSAQLQVVTQQIPGINCGVAFGENDIDQCCVPLSAAIPKFSEGAAAGFWNAVKSIPLFGSIPDEVDKKIDQVNSSFTAIGNNQCIEPGKPDSSSGKCICKSDLIATPSTAVLKLCTKYLTQKDSTTDLKNCLSCAASGSMYTGLGCIPLNLKDFISQFLLKWGIGIAGGIALLCIIYSAFLMQTSMGNPEKIKRAQENLTSCILGLILIIFSVFILKLIGVDILRIPGFGS